MVYFFSSSFSSSLSDPVPVKKRELFRATRRILIRIISSLNRVRTHTQSTIHAQFVGGILSSPSTLHPTPLLVAHILFILTLLHWSLWRSTTAGVISRSRHQTQRTLTNRKDSDRQRCINSRRWIYWHGCCSLSTDGIKR